MPAFTQGKWVDCGDYTVGVEDNDGTIKCWICECESIDDNITDEEAHANARLIAAAPELLEVAISYWHLIHFLVKIVPDEMKKDLPRVSRNLESLLARIDGKEE